MSDLTITTAGVTESKVSGGEFLSSDKKLNQMNIDIIEYENIHDFHAEYISDILVLSINEIVTVSGDKSIKFWKKSGKF